MHIEHITLQPHPLDAWRDALDALIACAPGNQADVANHLFDAARRVDTGKRHQRPNNLQQRLVAKLIIAGDLPNPSRPLTEAGAREICDAVSRLKAVAQCQPASEVHPSIPARPAAPRPSTPDHGPAPLCPDPAGSPAGVPAPDTPWPSGHPSPHER